MITVGARAQSDFIFSLKKLIIVITQANLRIISVKAVAKILGCRNNTYPRFDDRKCLQK